MDRNKVDQDSRKIRQLSILALVLFLIACILGIFILFQPDENRFQYYLDQSDLYLDAERYRDVPDLLMKASRYADTELHWFSLFKRSYLACLQTDDYASFYDLVQRSRKFMKNGPEQNALNTASLLWTNQYEKASASLYAIGQPGFETLTAESLLSFEVYRNYSLDGIDPIEFIKDKISFQEDPDFFQIIGTLSHNDALLYNAVLLYMESGRYEEAEAILRKLSSNRIQPFRIGVVYYDLGLLEQALTFFQAQDIIDDMKENQRFSLKQQIGDLQYLLGMKEKALASYEKGLSLHDAGSWKQYLNIARIYFDKGYARKAKLVLEEGLRQFPDQIALLKDYVHFYAEDNSLAVRNALDAYINHFPDNMEARLLKIRYFPDPMSPIQYQSQLWEYFNKSENNESVTRFLLWYLAGLGDYESIEIVLHRYSYEGEKPHWYLFYEGIFHYLEKDADLALEKMEEAYALYPSWLYERNMALLNYRQGNLEMAMMQLQNAVSSLTAEDSIVNKTLVLSDMYGELGEMYFDQEDFEDAVESLETAVQFNSENHEAQSLLNRIQ